MSFVAGLIHRRTWFASIHDTFLLGTISLKDILKKSSAAVLYKTGLLSLVGHTSPGNLTILALHRVVTDVQWSESLYKSMMITVGQFESLLGMISRNYHPVSLAAAVQQIREGKRFKPGTVVITFDDGYLDVYQHAYPLLRAYDIPATLFITTGVIGGDCKYLWWDEIDYFCQTYGRMMPDLDESFSPELRTAVRLMAHLSDTRTADIEASIRATLLGIPVAERDRFIERLRASAPADEARPPLMLSWDQVREMSGLIEISNHTVNHRSLDEVNAQEIQQEISVAKKRVEQVTGEECQGGLPRRCLYTQGGWACQGSWC